MPIAISVEELGRELAQRRQELEYTLRDVERVTGVSAATLSRIERGNRPDLAVVSKLARWLGVNVQTGDSDPGIADSDEDLKRSIEVHLRAKKNLSPKLARDIAKSFDVVMRVEVERAEARKKK